MFLLEISQKTERNMSLKFYLRKKSGNVKVNFRYRNGVQDIVLSTPFTIDVENWDSVNECYKQSLKKKSPRNEIDKNTNITIDTFNNKLSEFKVVLDQFIISQNYLVTSESLQKFMDSKYTIKKKSVKENTIPILFYDFVGNYIEQKSKHSVGKQKPITDGTIKKYNVIRNKVKKINQQLKVSEIDDKFRDIFTQWNVKNKYSVTTIVKELKLIKGFVKFAETKKIKINKEVDSWTFHIPKKEYKYPTFDLVELKRISEKFFEQDYLDNARDWLLIGCYTGLRVSDLLRLNKSMIVLDEFISFKQKKTDEDVTIYLLPPVKEILKKRNGEFPRKICDQRFNEYIKTVCEKSGIDQNIRGGKMINKRKVDGIYPKWELITSHSCRRTFVTQFRHILGDEGVIINTGHKTVSMLDLYDQNNPLERAMKIKQKMDQVLRSQVFELN